MWRFQSETGRSVDVKAYDNPRILLNLTVWDDLESLWNYVYKTDHVEFLRRRREWFEVDAEPVHVMWWVREGHRPTPAEGIARLEHLRAHGSSPHASRFGTTTNLRPDEHVRSRRSRGCPVRVGCLRVRVRRIGSMIVALL